MCYDLERPVWVSDSCLVWELGDSWGIDGPHPPLPFPD